MSSAMSKKTLYEMLILLLTSIATFTVGMIACKVSHGQQIPKQRGPLGLPPTQPEIDLGRRLFFDTILSARKDISCATCHNPSMGWSDGNAVAIGTLNRAGTRATPTLINVAYMQQGMFWDSRAIETSDQALLPIGNRREMGQDNEGQRAAELRMLRSLRGNSSYVSQFAAIYSVDAQSGSVITATRVARCLACFETELTSFNAPIDRYLAGDSNALSSDAKIGYELAKRADCFSCHTPPLYTDNKSHNCGIEYATRGRVTDRGLAITTNRDSDVGKFKTPTLRSIGMTAPYMHNGQLKDLESVVKHFNNGAYVKNKTGRYREKLTDTRIKEQEWVDSQQHYVVEFLRTAFEGSDYPLIGAP